MNALRLASLASFSLLALAGCNGGPAASGPTGTSLGALEAAPLDTTHTFAVGICIGPLSDGDAGPSGTCAAGVSDACTGTLIAPNLVLTARHCVESPTVNAPLALCTDHTNNLFEVANLSATSDVRVTVDPSVRLGAPRWHTVSVITLPTGTTPCDDDVALLRLSDNVAAADAAPIPADIYTDLAVNNPGHVTIVGRGAIAETYDPDGGALLTYDRGDYSRRILTNIPVMCVSDTDAVCHITDYTFQLPPNGFDLTRGVFTFAGPTAHGGDSGSGVLDQARYNAGLPTVIGVTSYEGIDATGHSDSNFAVRLTQHHDLIATEAMAAATAGSYAVPTWVASAPIADAGTDGGSADATAGDASTGTDVVGTDAATGTDVVTGSDVVTGHDAGANTDVVVSADHGTVVGGGGGCGCTTAPTRSPSAPLGVVGAALALGLAATRRRRRR